MHGTEPCKGFVLLALQPQPAGPCTKCHRLVWFSPEFQIWYEACRRRTGGGRPEKKGRKSDLYLTMSKNPTQPNYKMGGNPWNPHQPPLFHPPVLSSHSSLPPCDTRYRDTLRAFPTVPFKILNGLGIFYPIHL